MRVKAMRASRSAFVEAENALIGLDGGPAPEGVSIGNANKVLRNSPTAGGEMLRSWLEVEELRQFCPSREFFVKHARTIAISVAALALWAAFPILTIPVFGIALPLGAGWLLLKSMIEDQRLAAKHREMERAAIEILRQAIEEKKVVSLPIQIRDKCVDTPLKITRADERGVEGSDPNRRISKVYPWSSVDIEKLYRDLGFSEPGGEEAMFSSQETGGSVVRFPGTDRPLDLPAWRRYLGAAVDYLKSLRADRE